MGASLLINWSHKWFLRDIGSFSEVLLFLKIFESELKNIKKEIFYMVVLKKVYGLGERKDGGEKSDTLKIASKAVYREEVEKDNIKVDAYLTKEQVELCQSKTTARKLHAR